MTLEVCVIAYWSDVRDARVSISVQFHSLLPSSTEITLVSSHSLMYSYLQPKGKEVLGIPGSERK